MSHVISQPGLDLIKRFEGFEPEVYDDVAGYPTIGYGHLIAPPESVEDYRGGISLQKAELLLRQDVAQAEASVRRLIRVQISQLQYDALVSFTFNLGGGALQRSTLRQKLNRGEHDEIPAELKKWVYAGGRKVKGLIRRREAEAQLYELGTQFMDDYIVFAIPKAKPLPWLRR